MVTHVVLPPGLAHRYCSRSGRDRDASPRCRADCADGRSNTMAAILDAVNAYATLGEIMGVMRAIFGEYRELVVV